ncbi:winged helix-turn-helix domain-containing protein [Mangrovicella endophytica]|uniref:winged helix-turn-helix domain-containing protein n=1 Tax=Mangrovicella endophytica TaxID=2066697 RepID=UPI000C9E124A|nr:crosslink repair DNA glycosylase YcaQ family protein [Mangrovicella endophytica]
MPRRLALPLTITKAQARRIWLRAQRLDAEGPFGDGPDATRLAVEHLGYVQIDTINVIERCHHHILWNRIPTYRREHLQHAQSKEKSVFEYWTHALSYVPTRDFRFFLGDMKRHRLAPRQWNTSVSKADLRKVVERIRRDGPLTIRDIDDDVLVEKDHAWASRKPSKRALQLAFYNGTLVISARAGMLKTYELTERHFGWVEMPRPATDRQVLDYMLDRALRAQGLVSLDSICHLAASKKPDVKAIIESRVKQGRLRPVLIEDEPGAPPHWSEPETLESIPETLDERVHILSPFDPLIIQRKRLQLFFGYDHRFEAYVPKEKRLFGYFALPVLIGDRIVAVIDAKADREARRLLIQQWTSVSADADGAAKPLIEEALHRFEGFQLAG